MSEKERISIVVPCYNEEESLPLFYDEFCRVRALIKNKYPIDFQLLLIDDGSKDRTIDKMKELSQKDDEVEYVSFSRNFGKEAGIFAGLERADGDYVAMVDADLQDPLELLLEMYESLHDEEYDCVATRRKTRRGEPKIRSFFAKAFYSLINKFGDTEIVDGARDYRLMKRKMVDSILEMREVNRFSKGIFSWVGYRTKWISYDNIERVAGKTKWSFWGLLLYAMDGIIAFSTAPLSIAVLFGMLFSFIAMVMIVVIIVRTLIWGDPVAGYPSTMCVIFLVSGVQLFCIGVIGQYLSKTYLETKRRPIYFVKDSSLENEG